MSYNLSVKYSLQQSDKAVLTKMTRHPLFTVHILWPFKCGNIQNKSLISDKQLNVFDILTAFLRYHIPELYIFKNVPVLLVHPVYSRAEMCSWPTHPMRLFAGTWPCRRWSGCPSQTECRRRPCYTVGFPETTPCPCCLHTCRAESTQVDCTLAYL